MNLFGWIRAYLGVAMLAGAVLFAVARVAYNQWTYETSDATVIRICHWQLEAGFRESLQRLIDDYEKQYYERHGKRVKIVQVPIADRAFKEYMNTALIGGNPPDIFEKGQSQMARDPSYLVRFFRPLGAYMDEPNPYNAGTDLEGVPWRETFFDGMQNGFDPMLMEFYHVPFSMFTMRVYYNRDLYRRLTGRGEAPATYEELLATCELVGKASGGKVSPFAGSKYQASVLRNRYETPFYYDLMHELDENFDGDPSVQELYVAHREGAWSFRDDRFKMAWQCLADLTSYFQDGWTAAQRDDAVFMFVQERAMMYVSGSWDAPSLKAQVAGKFEVGVFDFPMPLGHAEYGRYVKAPVSEAGAAGGIPWSITRHSRHPEICVDFLRYCTTQANNARFNAAITWLPAVRGVKLTDELAPFRPRMEGFAVGDKRTGGMHYQRIGPRVDLVAEGLGEPMMSKKITAEKYADALTEAYELGGREGFLEGMDKQRQSTRDLERILVADLMNRLRSGKAMDRQEMQRVMGLMTVIQESQFWQARSRQRFEAVDRAGGGQ